MGIRDLGAGGVSSEGLSMRGYLERQMNEHDEVFAELRAEAYGPFISLTDVCVKAMAVGKKIVLFGNGGSAADAQHIATELVVRFGGTGGRSRPLR